MASDVTPRSTRAFLVGGGTLADAGAGGFCVEKAPARKGLIRITTPQHNMFTDAKPFSCLCVLPEALLVPGPAPCDENLQGHDQVVGGAPLCPGAGGTCKGVRLGGGGGRHNKGPGSLAPAFSQTGNENSSSRVAVKHSFATPAFYTERRQVRFGRQRKELKRGQRERERER